MVAVALYAVVSVAGRSLLSLGGVAYWWAFQAVCLVVLVVAGWPYVLRFRRPSGGVPMSDLCGVFKLRVHSWC